MLDEALGQAAIDIAQHLQEHYSGTDVLVPHGEPRLEETGIEFLVRLHVRNTADFLWEIQNKTNCADLREALEPIFNLPTIIRRQL